MIKLHKSTSRRYVKSGSQEMWVTFGGGSPEDPLQQGFRGLESFNDIKLAPGAELQVKAEEGQEILTYVQEGDLLVCQEKHEGEVLRSGYYHCTGSHRPLTTRVTTVTPGRGAHLFVTSIAREVNDAPTPYERKHFPFSSRRGVLRLIASPDGSEASLRVRKDVRVYSSLLDEGRHIVHELRAGRGAWLHVVEGRVRLVDQILEAGDGASLEDEMAVSLTAQAASEILLFDLA